MHPTMDPISAQSHMECLAQLDDSTAHLLWYARARRYRAMKPLRIVALPTELLHKPWVEELKPLIEEDVISHDAYTNTQSDTEAASCRAVVVYRPLLRAMQSWKPKFIVPNPVVKMLGLLWAKSLHT